MRKDWYGDDGTKGRHRRLAETLEAEGQLIVTTNLDMPGLERMLCREGMEHIDGPLLRRLKKLEVRDYWKDCPKR